MSDIRQLYQRIIVDHANYPHHYGELKTANYKKICRNPDCGDTISIFALIVDGQFIDVSFTGNGCIISQASASMLMDILINQSVDVVLDRMQNFSKLIMGQSVDANELGDSIAFSTLSEFPTRVRCGALAWHAMSEIINDWRATNG